MEGYLNSYYSFRKLNNNIKCNCPQLPLTKDLKG